MNSQVCDQVECGVLYIFSTEERKFYSCECGKCVLNKIFVEEKKEQAVEQATDKVECECGSVVKRSGLVKHLKTKKHLRYANGEEVEVKEQKEDKMVVCECGSSLKESGMKRHVKTKKHIKYEEGGEVEVEEVVEEKQVAENVGEEKVECKCGSTVKKSGMAKHKRTKKHLKYLEEKEDELEIVEVVEEEVEEEVEVEVEEKVEE